MAAEQSFVLLLGKIKPCRSTTSNFPLSYMSAGHLGPTLPSIYTEFLPYKVPIFALAGS
jgi:hypothetical protein